MVFIAVHTGAGYYANDKRKKYLEICAKACETAVKNCKHNNNNTAIDYIDEAISYLENETITNAGHGSNLNSAGYVECDALVMDGKDLLFGSVGAIQSIKNPIKVARLILENQRLKPPLGLIAPNFIVGEGARKFALSHSLPEFDLTCERSLNIFNKNKRKLEDYESMTTFIDKHQRFDTIGAVCIDDNNCLASGVSSGGLILKKEGRIGQASIPGSGCWTEGNLSVTTSGIGEYIVRTSLARKTVEILMENNEGEETSIIVDKLVKIFDNNFFGSSMMKNVPKEDHLAGILGLSNETNHIEMFWAHSTRSMGIGYMDSSFTSAKSFISNLDDRSEPGHSIVVQSKIFTK